MLMQASWYSGLLFVFFVWKGAVIASGTAEFDWKGNINVASETDWIKLSTFDQDDLLSDCKDNVTTMDIKNSSTLIINFQPKDQYGTLGVSLCRDDTRENCYVLEIFGLFSGRLGYFWRKVDRNATGDHSWIPGAKDRLPSALIKSDVVAKEGTWDPEGRTLYQIYLDITTPDNVAIRYNGGIAKQQREMTFDIPIDEYSFLTVASKNDDSQVDVAGAKGCPVYRPIILEPQQYMRVNWYKPVGTLGISLCTDSGQNECYVLELDGFSENKTSDSFSWRKHSLVEEDGEEGWIPGSRRKLNGIVLAHEKFETKFEDNSAWTGKKNELLLIFVTYFDEEMLKVKVHFKEYDENQVVVSERKIQELMFDLPHKFQHTKIRNRAIVDGKEVIGADVVMQGPCFRGANYLSQLCKHDLDKNFLAEGDWKKIHLPKIAKAEANLMSEVLESKGTRKTLCMSLRVMLGAKGILKITAMDATNSTNKTVQVGQVTYNNVFPYNWQRVRMSVELPAPLQNVPLIVNIKAERPTAESFVMLNKIKLCSYDGCGVPTPDGTPFIALGKKTNPAKYPWHVAIFQKVAETDFIYICGGTMIRADVVVSAAHCFEKDGMVQDKGKFKLTVGKKYNSLLVHEPNQQISDALNIYIAPRYKGEINNYVHDIAIVQVNFTISSKVLPACLDWHGNNASGLAPGDVGQVAGWGLNEANILNEELYFAELPYIPYEECIKTVPKSFVVFVTHDKLCAGNINGATVKKGDSGGGLVFQKGGLWYLHGVVSLGVPHELTYSTFTEVSQFIPWIRTMLNYTY